MQAAPSARTQCMRGENSSISAGQRVAHARCEGAARCDLLLIAVIGRPLAFCWWEEYWDARDASEILCGIGGGACLGMPLLLLTGNSWLLLAEAPAEVGEVGLAALASDWRFAFFSRVSVSFS